MKSYSQLRRALPHGQSFVQANLKESRGLDKFNAFISVPSINAAQHDGPLAGTTIAVKDNICTLDLPTTCASRGLKSFISPYDASVVSKLRRAGATICGKTNLDEFGMGYAQGLLRRGTALTQLQDLIHNTQPLAGYSVQLLEVLVAVLAVARLP